MRRIAALLFLVVLLAPACDPEPEPPAEPPPFRHAAFYDAVQGYAEELTLVDGDYKEDWGDAAFFGLGFYAQEGTTGGNDEYLVRAQELYQRNLTLIQEQNLLTGDVNEIAMSLLGLIEYMAATGDTSGLADVDAMIGSLNELMETAGYYLTPEAIGSWAVDFYGPVSINGYLALISLQRAYLLDGGDDDLVETAAAIVEQLRERYWNGSYYEFGEDRDDLLLYPNITMIMLHVRLYQLTGDQAQLDQALATYDGMQPLRVTEDSGLAGPGRYFSPYSRDIEGAATEDYSTLSSQNYLMMSLMLLYEATEDPRYLEETDAVLDFLEQSMVGEWCLSQFHVGVECDPACTGDQVCAEDTCVDEACHTAVLHHWIDGRLATPDDTVLVCAGCNLQLLYVMWYRQHVA